MFAALWERGLLCRERPFGRRDLWVEMCGDVGENRVNSRWLQEFSTTGDTRIQVAGQEWRLAGELSCVCISEKLWIQCSPEVKMQRVLNCNRLLCLAFSFSKCIMFSHFSYKKMAFGKTAFWKMASSVILNLAPGKTALSNLLWRMRILRRAAVIHQMMMMCEDFCNTCRSPFVLVKIMGMCCPKTKIIIYVVTCPLQGQWLDFSVKEAKNILLGVLKITIISL